MFFSTVEMHRPNEYTKECDHDKYLRFIMLDLSDDQLQGMTKKVAAGSDGYRPDKRSSSIQQNELYDGYAAHAYDKGGNCAQSVKEPERQYHWRLKSVPYPVNLFHLLLPSRAPVQNRLTVFAPQIKKKLVAAKAAEKSR